LCCLLSGGGARAELTPGYWLGSLRDHFVRSLRALLAVIDPESIGADLDYRSIAARKLPVRWIAA